MPSRVPVSEEHAFTRPGVSAGRRPRDRRPGGRNGANAPPRRAKSSLKPGWMVDLGTFRFPLFLSQTFACVSLNRYSNNMTSHSYIITFFITCFILPLGVIFFCYGKLLRKLRKVSGGRRGSTRHRSDESNEDKRPNSFDQVKPRPQL